MKEEYYNYETKCRKCGKLTIWNFASKKQIIKTDFLIAIQDYITAPRIMDCFTCKKQTVQEVVSIS